MVTLSFSLSIHFYSRAGHLESMSDKYFEESLKTLNSAIQFAIYASRYNNAVKFAAIATDKDDFDEAIRRFEIVVSCSMAKKIFVKKLILMKNIYLRSHYFVRESMKCSTLIYLHTHLV